MIARIANMNSPFLDLLHEITQKLNGSGDSIYIVISHGRTVVVLYKIETTSNFFKFNGTLTF